jgi:uncharacterized protein
MIDLDQRQKKLVIHILQEIIPNATTWVFGSRAEGRARETSDLDLAIISPKEIENHILLDIKEKFDESDLDIKVDIVEFEKLPPSLKNHILKNHIILIETV